MPAFVQLHASCDIAATAQISETARKSTGLPDLAKINLIHAAVCELGFNYLLALDGSNAGVSETDICVRLQSQRAAGGMPGSGLCRV